MDRREDEEPTSSSVSLTQGVACRTKVEEKERKMDSIFLAMERRRVYQDIAAGECMNYSQLIYQSSRLLTNVLDYSLGDCSKSDLWDLPVLWRPDSNAFSNSVSCIRVRTAVRRTSGGKILIQIVLW